MRTLVYIIFIIVVTGCSQGASHIVRELDEAERLMQTDPSAAMERLNDVDVASVGDSATLARWALLYSEALVANRITVPTDTIIDIAVSWYGQHDFRELFQHASRLKALLRNEGEADQLSTALYLQKEKEFMLYRERVRRERTLYTAIVLFLVAGGVIAWQRQRLKLNEARNEALIAEASSLKDSLARRKDECSLLKSQLSESLDGRFRIIDDLCATYYEQQGSRTERKAIVEKVKSHIDALKADEGVFAEMERCNADILTLFRKEFAEVKPDDYRLMVYLAAGLSNRTIALLIGESIDTAYKRKSRLKAKITASGTADKARFLELF